MPVVRDFAEQFRLPNECGGTDAIVIIHEVRRPDVGDKFTNELSVSVVKCGMVFDDAITVVEPRSLNPALRILAPIGINLIMAVIKHVTGENMLQPLEPPDEDNLPF